MLDSALVDLLFCPDCKGGLYIKDDKIVCNDCDHMYITDGNEINFTKTKKQTESPENSKKRNIKTIYNYIKNNLNPILSPLSPLTVITKHRVNNYYKDILLNKDRARKFFHHYLNKAKLKPGDVVFEFGCGKGRIAAVLSLLEFKVIGCDIYNDNYRKKIENSLFYVKNSETLGIYLKANSCKMVVDFMTLNYISADKVPEYFNALLNVLDKDGYLLLLSANPESYGSHIFHKYQPNVYNKNFITDILIKQRFNIIETKFEGFYSPFFPILINWFRKNLQFQFELFDYNSKLATLISPIKRGHFWILAQKETKI